MSPRHWRDDAACFGADPGLFFPEKTGPADPEAQRICASCAVADNCLAYALTRSEKYGFWGGKTADERREMRAELKLRKAFDPPECGTEAGYAWHKRRDETPCGACREGAARARHRRWLENPTNYRARRKESQTV